MSLVEDMLVFVPTLTTGLVVGTNFFGDLLPDEPIKCVAVIATPGAGPDEVFGNDLPPVTRPRLQLMVRDATYAEAKTTVEQIWKGLMVVANIDINGTHYYRIGSTDVPSLLRKNARNNPIFSCNFDVSKQV
jgi:hypothetical protein